MMLKLSNISKSFLGLKAIEDLSFEVREGQHFGVIGANGAGKTTLLNLITGYLRSTSGAMQFEGRNITGLRPFEIAHLGIARTFQITQPFSEMTVLENVMTGALFCSSGQGRTLGEARAACEEPIRLVGLENYTGVQAGVLTLGSKKKLELARALATQPKLLLLDEVMGGLTPSEIDDLMDTLRRVKANGITILMIEHVMSVVMALSDHLMVLDFGKKLFEGYPNDVVQRSEVIEAYLGRPLESAVPA